MILQFETPRPEAAWRDRLADCLLEQAPALCGNPALASAPALCEAAQGVAAVLQEQETFPQELTPHASCTLLSRALEAAGEAPLARRLHLAGSSSVYAASWITAGQDTVWTLDVRNLTSGQAPCTELLAFDRLREMLNAYADVWDGAGGRGVLGLKRLSETAGAILGPRATPAEKAALAGEMRAYCGQCLDLQRQRRGWHSSPVILSIGA